MNSNPQPFSLLINSSSLTKNRLTKYIVSLFIILVIGLSLLFISKRIFKSPLSTEPSDQAPTVQSDIPIPVYPEATLISSREGAPDEELIYQGIWETDAFVPQAMQWYTRTLKEKQWKIYLPPSDPNYDRVQQLIMVKHDFRLIINISREQAQDPSLIVAHLEKPKSQLVEGFPLFPVYPGAYVIDSQDQTVDTPSFSASWQVSSAVPQVMDWYVNNLSHEDWAIIDFPSNPLATDEQIITTHNDHWHVWLKVASLADGQDVVIKAELNAQEL